MLHALGVSSEVAKSEYVYASHEYPPISPCWVLEDFRPDALSSVPLSDNQTWQKVSKMSTLSLGDSLGS